MCTAKTVLQLSLAVIDFVHPNVARQNATKLRVALPFPADCRVRTFHGTCPGVKFEPISGKLAADFGRVIHFVRQPRGWQIHPQLQSLRSAPLLDPHKPESSNPKIIDLKPARLK